jgi:hypothetical protein
MIIMAGAGIVHQPSTAKQPRHDDVSSSGETIMVTNFSSKTQSGIGKVSGQMRSPQGVAGALVVLLMVPLSILYGLLFAHGVDTFVHWVLAAGAMLMALAVFDFGKVPAWLQWVGALAAGGLALIVFLQGLSHLLPNEWLSTLAYGFFAQWPEPWLLRLFLYGWGGALLLTESRGRTRTVGLIALLIVLGMELFRFGGSLLGLPPVEALRVLYLLPFVWLLLESRKSPS